MIARIITLYGLLVFVVRAKMVDFTGDTADRIFSKHEIILIFIQASENPEGNAIMSQVCLQALQCAQLHPESTHYDHIRKFIGYPGDSLIAIIDSANQYKYVLPIQVSPTGRHVFYAAQAILDFRLKFDQKKLEPFFASEEPPIEGLSGNNCIKLVGSNYEQFLSQEEPLKIVYLYSSDSVCHNCQDLLEKYTSIAERHSEHGTLLLGYFDVTLNDHRLIRDEIFPYFLIYVFDNFEDPYGVEVEEFSELETYITQLKKDVRKVRETDDQSQADEQEQL